MAKRKINKSAKIREYKAANPAEGPTAISKALNAQGIKVTPQQVSTTLNNDKKKEATQPARRGPKPGAAVVAKSNISFEEVMKAKRLASELGGVANAKAALDALSKIVD